MCFALNLNDEIRENNGMKHLVLIASYHSNAYASFSLLYRLLVSLFDLAFFRFVFLVLIWDEIRSLPSHHTFPAFIAISDGLNNRAIHEKSAIFYCALLSEWKNQIKCEAESLIANKKKERAIVLVAKSGFLKSTEKKQHPKNHWHQNRSAVTSDFKKSSYVRERHLLTTDIFWCCCSGGCCVSCLTLKGYCKTDLPSVFEIRWLILRNLYNE